MEEQVGEMELMRGDGVENLRVAPLCQGITGLVVESKRGARIEVIIKPGERCIREILEENCPGLCLVSADERLEAVKDQARPLWLDV